MRARAAWRARAREAPFASPWLRPAASASRFDGRGFAGFGNLGEDRGGWGLEERREESRLRKRGASVRLYRQPGGRGVRVEGSVCPVRSPVWLRSVGPRRVPNPARCVTGLGTPARHVRSVWSERDH